MKKLTVGIFIGFMLALLAPLSAQFSTTGRTYRKVASQNCSGACTVDLSQGTMFKVTLTGAVTSLSFSNGLAGALYQVQFCQDGTGARTIAGVEFEYSWYHNRGHYCQQVKS